MNLKINRKLETAQINLNDSHPKEALEIIKQLDSTKLTESDFADYLLIKAEALLLCYDYNHDLPQKAVDYLRFTDDHNRYGMAMYLLGWQYQFLSKPEKSRAALLEAYGSFQRSQNYSLSARTLNRLAYVYFFTGENKLAIYTIKKAITFYEKVKQHTNTLRARNNLAMTLYTLGRFKEAEAEYTEIEKYISFLKSKSIVCHKLGYSIVIAHQGKIDQALSILNELKPLAKEFPREYAIYYQYIGWIHLIDKDLEEAKKRLNKALNLSIEIGKSISLVSTIKMLLADLHCQQKEYNQAIKLLDDAERIAKLNNEKAVIGCCHRTRARIYADLGDEQKAKENYEIAIEILKSIDSNYELSITRYYAAKSKIYNRSDNIGLLYLAKEYFKSEEITSFIKLIDLELNFFTSETHSAKRTPITLTSCPTIITRNQKVLEQLNFARKVAPSKHNVLLSGETGTGKDLMARYIHYHSNFSGKFISINMAAIPNEMVEAELFGHAKGAYTGASNIKAGLFEEADNGTLYLNEIADTSPQLQAKLLEVLETREVRRLGENKTRKVSFRLIAASNYKMKELIAANKFRPDLYYRLNEIPIKLIPLKERIDDIAELTKYFMKDNGYIFNGENKYEDKLFEILSKKVWEGNIRELKAEVSNLCIVSELDIKKMVHLAKERIEITEEGTLLKLLDRHGWNRREVARQLGISEATVRRKIKKYNFSEDQI